MKITRRMAARFRDLPIRQKLTLSFSLTTLFALGLAGCGIVSADLILSYRGIQRDLSTVAQIVGDNSVGALAFNDARVGGETLAALRARTHVQIACLYKTDGTRLADYTRPGYTGECPKPDRERIARAGSVLVVSHEIDNAGRRAGVLVLRYDLGELLERAQLFGGTVLAALAFASIIALILSAKLRDLITTPVVQLARAAKAVTATGDYSIRAQKLSGDEMGVLVDGFNEMLSGIQSRDSDLKKALFERGAALQEVNAERQRFRFMADSMPQKIFTAGPSGETVYLNRLWMEFTGLSFEEISENWVQFIHPEDRELSTEAWRSALATGEPLDLTNRFRRADGVYRWHLIRARAMRDSGGRITLWVGSCTEIHEQKEKEDALRRANEDLQQFAYSASHDLQEPIRNVTIYGQIIAEEYNGLLDDEGRQYLGFLIEGGKRLTTLVRDLLAYTRASMAELNETAGNTSVILNSALASLAELIRETNASITHDDLPDIQIGASHLQLILQNLLSNALKYRGTTPLRIHISAVSRGPSWCFSVQDNGIGIDPQYKERIFGVFKRLHHGQQYAGTGIGLAICQRLVERYGGRIWVESALGQGATFYFLLPKRGHSARSAATESAPGGG